MMKRSLIFSAMLIALAMAGGSAFAADQPAAKDKSQAPKQTPKQDQEQVYGSDLMTPQERNEHRNKMRAAKTAEEREKIRKDHHERMKARAKERGVTIPDEPPLRGDGMGRGMGRGRQ